MRIEERSSPAGGVGVIATPTGGNVLRGHFSVSNVWTEIAGPREGNFMERVAPGAFRESMLRDAGSIRVLFNHGRDPSIGDKVLGPLRTLGEDERGAYYEADLIDTAYNRELIPGLRAGLYGASFRFQVVREAFEDAPRRSTYNPKGLPERTIKEARLFELGPVTWPAYAGATAGLG